jgi:hypothetical protein
VTNVTFLRKKPDRKLESRQYKVCVISSSLASFQGESRRPSFSNPMVANGEWRRSHKPTPMVITPAASHATEWGSGAALTVEKLALKLAGSDRAPARAILIGV